MAGGIVRATIRVLLDELDVQIADLLVGTGPAIRGPSYEVGPDVAGLFPEAFSVPSGDPSQGRALLDLPSCALAQAAGAGIPRDNLVDFSLCTFTHADDLFSHRRGDRGRHWAFIGKA
jgi:copper oxidase (laccase) domain-containing protein